MWSHSNIFYKKGKEFCDVMVVFGNDVIIMSDKLINYNSHIDEQVAWNRWYKSAIGSSIKQLNGAKKHIKQYPSNLYTNAQATVPFLMDRPPSDEMRIHLIAIANGCADACKKKHGRYSLNIYNENIDNNQPFTVGIEKVNFVHIFNDYSLDKLFLCLDTTRDFIDYLEARKKLLSTCNKRINIYGEEELLAAWMLSQPGNAPYHMPYELFNETKGNYHIGPGLWDIYDTKKNRETRRKSRCDSYIIDNLINHIYDEHANQRMIIGQENLITYHEKAFRLLASESRLGRQLISIPLHEVIQEDPNYFWANIVESTDTPGLLYLWLIYPDIPGSISDEMLLNILLSQLKKYLLVAQLKFRHMKTLFGACLPNIKTNRSDRLFIINDGSNWSEEMQKLALKLESEESILSNIVSTKKYSARI